MLLSSNRFKKSANSIEHKNYWIKNLCADPATPSCFLTTRQSFYPIAQHINWVPGLPQLSMPSRTAPSKLLNLQFQIPTQLLLIFHALPQRTYLGRVNGPKINCSMTHIQRRRNGNPNLGPLGSPLCYIFWAFAPQSNSISTYSIYHWHHTKPTTNNTTLRRAPSMELPRLRAVIRGESSY